MILTWIVLNIVLAWYATYLSNKTLRNFRLLGVPNENQLFIIWLSFASTVIISLVHMYHLYFSNLALGVLKINGF